MTQLIDKSALVAEIEKLKAYLQIPNAQLEAIQVCDNVISVINTLEVKEVDLDKLIDDYMLPITAQDVKEEPFTQLEKCAKHFFKLGIKAQKVE